MRRTDRVAMGANDVQTVRALREAEAWSGPSLVIAYATCIAHGVEMGTSMDAPEGCGPQRLLGSPPLRTALPSAAQSCSPQRRTTWTRGGGYIATSPALREYDLASGGEGVELADDDDVVDLRDEVVLLQPKQVD